MPKPEMIDDRKVLFELSELGICLVQATEEDSRKMQAAHEFLRVCGEDLDPEVKAIVLTYAGSLTVRPI